MNQQEHQQELVAAIEKLQTQTDRVASEAIAARERLETLQTAIPESVAMGDGTLTRELRDERRNLECVVRDAEESEKVLARKREAALHELAKVELPTARHQVETARDRLEETAEQTRTAVEAFLTARRVFLHTRNRAHEGDGRPTDDVQPRSRCASVIIGAIQDFGAQ